MTTAATDTTIYERNLALLQQIAPDLAQRLEAVEPAEGIEFAQASDGALTATVTQGGSVRTLASKRRPMDEAARLADTVDVTTTPAVVVAGFGLGYHVAELARRIGRTGIVIVYEPDVALLRAVLDRVDHTDWLTACRVLFLTDAGDSAAMSASISGVEGLVSMGLTLVEHPASKPRLAQHTKVFYDTLGSVLRALQTTVVTTLVQVRASVHNALMNLDHYARCPGVDDLKGLYAGRKAIVVSAGPSLQRNLHLLADPAVRNTHVIIAVQTVLKPMLARGIKPHFVVALDYHEISKRFYEGLTKEDVEGVTLIVQPIANPAILDAFPGTIRCVADQTLDRLLPQALRAEPNKGELTPGATVAHLAYYVARHLGCDPVGLIGQDLGFTDNQYYAAGAAIHDVWACELNPFRTLEMFEWERIARHKNMLIQKTDAMGRPIYTDEQMLTYLVQFERDFAADARKGLRTIDCTEGGVAKQSAPPLQLVQFLEQTQKSNEPISVPTPTLAQPSRKALLEHVQKVRRDVWNVGEISRQTRDLLVQMGEHHSDQQRVNTLIDRVHSLRDTVTALEPAYSLVHFLNQSGSYNRIRSDRTIDLSTMSELDRQKKRIERDIENVASLARAADDLGTLLDNTVAVLDGQPKLTRPPPLPPPPPLPLLHPTHKTTPARFHQRVSPRPARLVWLYGRSAQIASRRWGAH